MLLCSRTTSRRDNLEGNHGTVISVVFLRLKQLSCVNESHGLNMKKKERQDVLTMHLRLRECIKNLKEVKQLYTRNCVISIGRE